MVRDIPEDSAREHQLRVSKSVEHGSVTGVRLHEDDALESERVDLAPTHVDQSSLELDQFRADVGAPRVVLEDAEKVAAVAGAETDDADLPCWCGVEAVSDQAPDGDEPAAERRDGVVVGAVPRPPVGIAC